MDRSSPLAIDRLCAKEPRFAELRRRNGEPPDWRRPATFGTLTLLVLEQQVSLASARAAFHRLVDVIGDPVEPARFLPLGDGRLREIGFSRQKASYVRGIADRLVAGSLDLDHVASLDTERAVEALTDLRGVGPWTAACWTLFVNGAPDIWPSGDRALYVSIRNVFDLPDVPRRDEADALATAWRPDRSVAARMLWHDYLGGRSYRRPDGDGFLDTPGMVHP
ncbi:MAG: DNA-3-methyladenine glycosylase 2 family protein [Acidimicrobiia bacterium]|nr:DNA-3-methyladenine glycosylase 2 family protein [Acidimicrobiia bacterium]